MSLLKKLTVTLAFPFFLIANWAMDHRQQGIGHAFRETWEGVKSVWTKP